jgi:hypothetical protein
VNVHTSASYVALHTSTSTGALRTRRRGRAATSNGNPVLLASCAQRTWCRFSTVSWGSAIRVLRCSMPNTWSESRSWRGRAHIGATAVCKFTHDGPGAHYMPIPRGRDLHYDHDHCAPQRPAARSARCKQLAPASAPMHRMSAQVHASACVRSMQGALPAVRQLAAWNNLHTSSILCSGPLLHVCIWKLRHCRCAKQCRPAGADCGGWACNQHTHMYSMQPCRAQPPCGRPACDGGPRTCVPHTVDDFSCPVVVID